ncbi:sporulation protein [Peribacillus acanthi]|uniref:sporulation protein n=1 Tax=Peribacillus acanthi TaxID=2171554 RepID=UPI001300280F|nr:sporulation protein [Peribacillus acanthi]
MLKKSEVKIQMEIENFDYLPGELVKGEVVIHGGSVEQFIEHVDLRLMMNVDLAKGNIVKEMVSIQLESGSHLHANEQKVYHFSYLLPTNIPISGGSIHYYFESIVSMEDGFEKVAESMVIQPYEPIYYVFKALRKLGFFERESIGTVDRFGQSFVFFPTEQFVGLLKVAKFRFAFEQEDGIRVWLEIDGELWHEFFLDKTVVDQEEVLATTIQKKIEEVITHPDEFNQSIDYENIPFLNPTLPGLIGGLCRENIGQV